jgi:hypothetical protein
MPQSRVKTVGRRDVRERVDFADALAWQTTAATLFGRQPLCPRGVFRFRSHEEAHEWMISQAASRSPGARPART